MENESNLISISKTTVEEEKRESKKNTKEEKFESQKTNNGGLIIYERLNFTPQQSSKDKSKIIVKILKHIKQLPHLMNKGDHKCSSKKHVGKNGNQLSVQRAKFGGEQSFKKVYHCVLNQHSRSTTPTKPMRHFRPPQHQTPRHYNKDDYKAEYDNDNDYDYRDDYDPPDPKPGCPLLDDLARLLLFPFSCILSLPCMCFVICAICCHAILRI
ncbi:unnamed protein product [Arctia plantaginis]|uniref:Uncharacterized protein n=1 Tax=Arctia plantaginis TaxID=874455 RepID=A0A8S0ZYT1_ARCPL|nr:unnamed protein product [Arctia plantaginis]